MRITLDTGILVRVYLSPSGPAFRLTQAISTLHHVLVVSQYILDEVEAVRSYPRIRRRTVIGGQHIAAALRQAEMVIPVRGRPVILADPKDDPVLYTAVAGKADVLCTLDRHFHAPDVVAFCTEHGIRVMSDVELLRELLAGEAAEGHPA